VARITSLVVLLIILLLIGLLFIQVIAGFLLPLFLALLLVIMFRPVHRWFLDRLGRHGRIAAMLTTVAILLLVLIPLFLLSLEAINEAQGLYQTAVTSSELAKSTAPAAKQADNPSRPEPDASALAGDAAPAAKQAAEQSPPEASALADWLTGKLIDLANHLGMKLGKTEIEKSINRGLRHALAPMALRTGQFLAQTLFGFVIMILGVYYFYADGPQMIHALVRFSPLESDRTWELMGQFDDVTRAVVVATLFSAFAQGVLIGLGFKVAGVNSVFLLTGLAMLLTLVPFIGSAIIWAPVCLWLFLDGRTTTAVLLAIYCGVIAVVSDNVLRPMILHGRSKLHPLLALLSVLGGIHLLGPIGIFVGPMVVAFLQTLLNMIHQELTKMGKSPGTDTGDASFGDKLAGSMSRGL
jgi:predicted PurR-regulated permease PerM